MVLCSGKLTSVCRLSTVYNILGGNGTARYNTFYAMITYAAEAGKEHLAAVTPHCAHLESMFSEWGTDLDKQRALYTAIFDSLKKHNNRYILINFQNGALYTSGFSECRFVACSDAAHEYRLKFLNSYQGQKDQSTALKQAVIAVVEAIANPKVYQVDSYVNLDAVQALKSDSANSKVFDLLKIFAEDDLDTFNKFYTQNAAFVDGLGNRRLRIISAY